jgi:hypothetical protein
MYIFTVIPIRFSLYQNDYDLYATIIATFDFSGTETSSLPTIFQLRSDLFSQEPLKRHVSMCISY